MKVLHSKRRPPGVRSSFLVLPLFLHLLSACTASANVEILRGAAAAGGGGSRRLLQTNSTSNGTVPLVIAEGGAQYLYPEMTMRAYTAGMDSGADFVTCTLAITSDAKAFCHPDLELTKFTDIAQHPNLLGREFKFLQKSSLYSFNFTLAEIKTLRVMQTKPGHRTKAFDYAFPVATPEEVIAEINRRAAANPLAKRIGLVLEISNGTGEMERFALSPTPVTYAIDLLRQNGWTSPSSPAMVIAKLRSQLAAFVREGVLVRRLFRFLPNGAKLQIGEDLASSATDYSEAFVSLAANATGVIFHVGSVIDQTSEVFWGRAIPKAAWNSTAFLAARGAGLSAFVWGFEESDWSSGGARFNTFLADQVSLYRSLLFGSVRPLVAGLATDWPAAAAKTAACYASPVDIHPRQGLAVDRPLIISSGGSVGLLPAHTNLSFMQAVKDGADYIDCILQVTKDGVLFCLESMQLLKYTDVDEKEMFANRRTTYDGSNYWSFEFTWAEIQTLRVIPKTRNNNAAPDDTPRLIDFYNTLPPISFDDFISIAQNATRTVGIFVKIDNPTFLSGKGTLLQPAYPSDQIALLLSTLQRRGYLSPGNLYDRATAPPLLIASQDSCGLARMKALSNGTLPLIKRVGGNDTCEQATKDKGNTSAWWVTQPGLAWILTYADGLSPAKKLILKINNASLGTPLDGVITAEGATAVVTDAQALGLKVYVRAFRNDVVLGDTEGAFDFQSDPTMELQYYYDQLGVTALEAQFVATARSFFESSCRPRPGMVATDPGYTIPKLHPGELAAEINALQKSQPKDDTQTDNAGPSAAVIATVAAGACLLAMILAVLAFYCCRQMKKRRADKMFKDDLGSLANLPMLKVYPMSEIVAATNNFSDANRLGKGGFGTVYKAVLSDGVVVAVKKLHVEIKQNNESLRSDVSVRQLINEVEIIGTVHNRNVVPLQGVCMERELLLVYDFMPNGSLQDAIFEPDYPIKLDWKQWYKIALGTAKGLAYLHEECEHKIIHRDIKPANILLDAQLNPRVADFGLARNVQVDETHVTTKVMGSIGYMAPDYATTGQLTERSDTYSYGVLLLTIITGRKPVCFEAGEESCTLEWVKRKAQQGSDELLTVISPKFDGKYNRDEAIRWLYTALLCSQTEPGLRPSMSDVVQMLSGKRDVPEICVAPAAVIFPDYQRSHQPSQDSNSRFSYSGTQSVSTEFENSGLFNAAGNSVILEGR